MAKEFAGKGGKKPQFEIPIDLIHLDEENPRIVQYIDGENVTELDLISVMYQQFDTEVIALSLIENGYFDEEPIIVVPRDLPEGFSYENFQTNRELEDYFNSLIQKKEISFTVVEGNRRISAIKLLLSSELREKLGVNSIYPELKDAGVRQDISLIPSIFYEEKKQVSPYLGIRHIAGLLKWEAFAKAAYVAEMIEQKTKDGLSINDSVKRVQEVVADRSDVLRKQYVTYRLFREAQSRLEEYDVRPILNRFSLLQVIYNSGALRDYMGVEPYKKVDFDNEVIVPEGKLVEFEEVLTWVFGNKAKDIDPVLTDSRKITSKLSHVVNHPDAIQYLREYKNIDEAYERTDGEAEYLSKNLTRATRALETSLQFAYKHKGNEDLLGQLDSLEKLLVALKNNLSL